MCVSVFLFVSVVASVNPFFSLLLCFLQLESFIPGGPSDLPSSPVVREVLGWFPDGWLEGGREGRLTFHTPFSPACYLLLLSFNMCPLFAYPLSISFAYF